VPAVALNLLTCTVKPKYGDKKLKNCFELISLKSQFQFVAESQAEMMVLFIFENDLLFNSFLKLLFIILNIIILGVDNCDSGGHSVHAEREHGRQVKAEGAGGPRQSPDVGRAQEATREPGLRRLRCTRYSLFI
jgi:hypothetical protein